MMNRAAPGRRVAHRKKAWAFALLVFIGCAFAFSSFSWSYAEEAWQKRLSIVDYSLLLPSADENRGPSFHALARMQVTFPIAPSRAKNGYSIQLEILE